MPYNSDSEWLREVADKLENAQRTDIPFNGTHVIRCVVLSDEAANSMASHLREISDLIESIEPHGVVK